MKRFPSYAHTPPRHQRIREPWRFALQVGLPVHGLSQNPRQIYDPPSILSIERDIERDIERSLSRIFGLAGAVARSWPWDGASNRNSRCVRHDGLGSIAAALGGRSAQGAEAGVDHDAADGRVPDAASGSMRPDLARASPHVFPGVGKCGDEVAAAIEPVRSVL